MPHSGKAWVLSEALSDASPYHFPLHWTQEAGSHSIVRVWIQIGTPEDYDNDPDHPNPRRQTNSIPMCRRHRRRRLGAAAAAAGGAHVRGRRPNAMCSRRVLTSP